MCPVTHRERKHNTSDLKSPANMATLYPKGKRAATQRGAFVDRVWRCDCDPRLPAEKFKVKNGGKNHGRWFYTCQKPQHKRCGFFLWSDDAKVREEAAVLNNSRTEPQVQPNNMPQTPRKPHPNSLPPTPVTNHKSGQAHKTPTKPKTPIQSEDDDSFDWSSSNDQDLLNAEREVLLEQPVFETPRKAARTQTLTSPGKRRRSEVSPVLSTQDGWPLSDDVFATPTTSYKSSTTGLLSPTNTPAKLASQPDRPQPEPEPSVLATEALSILQGSNLSAQVEKDLVELLNRHHLRTQGIIKGRDITRVAVAAKDARIAELQARIATLEAERETNRTVISLLKHDMATSPKRPRNPTPSRRSVV
ncbi:hypothetical protein PV10_06269 [Exophiala mesophila]|uniref:GRF-type domain-containing protein n=1 Tax=Exophiala mesophila TaxID=212818 RepID=A0A0D1ZAQ4_EXOME|nr:uncharacterized protein PV10_06269 [Exophiala mesophila]KIV91762.1 hypothetical protein PV10_06269 [Exophiala mesophila]